MSGLSWHEGPEKTFCEAVKVKSFVDDSRMLEMPKSRDTCQEELHTACGTSPRSRSVLQSEKLKGVGDLKITLTSDMEMQNLEFVLLISGLALVQC